MQATTLALPTLDRPPSAADAGGIRRDTAGWAASLLVVAPLLLSPSAGGIADILAVAIAALSFGLAAAAGPCLPGLLTGPRSLTAGPGLLAAAALAAALASTATVGTGLAVVLALFVLVEACRRALGPDTGTGLALLAAGLALRLDAGAVALGLDRPPATVAAGCSLALFLTLLAGRRERVGRTHGRTPRGASRAGLALLAAAAGTVALYAAALLDDPRLRDAAGVWPLLTVPLVVAGLGGLWRRAGLPAGAATRGLDLVLLATGATWVGLLVLLLRGTSGVPAA